MNDPMTILKADHREVKKLLTALGDSEEGPERDKMTADVQLALTLHMKIEEEIVYPAVVEYVGKEDEEEPAPHRVAAFRCPDIDGEGRRGHAARGGGSLSVAPAPSPRTYAAADDSRDRCRGPDRRSGQCQSAQPLHRDSTGRGSSVPADIARRRKVT